MLRTKPRGPKLAHRFPTSRTEDQDRGTWKVTLWIGTSTLIYSVPCQTKLDRK